MKTAQNTLWRIIVSGLRTRLLMTAWLLALFLVGAARESHAQEEAAPAAPPAADSPSSGASEAAVSVEAKPPRPKVSVRAYNPVTTYTKMSQSDVADRIGLSAEQRVQVTEIMSERVAAIRQAKGDKKAESKAIIECEQNLAGVLTTQQLTDWSDKVLQRNLRINFRFQPWVDVFEWFSEEAGLSLVINTPPPGTFNYSDTKEHTPEEVIDVINAVLLTHGFTLIRRDQMLICQDLSRPIPEGLVPVVKVEELDQRGKNELVTVRFSMGRKEITLVQSEITPLVGPYGKMVVLPATKTLMVTETAGRLKNISQVIEAVPEPPIPKKPEPKPKEKAPPPPPVMKVYLITRADPDAVQTILVKMVPAATMEFDEKRGQLYVYTTENYHTTIEQVIENMETELPPEQRRTLEIYSIKEAGKPESSTSSATSSTPRYGGDVIEDNYGRPRYRIDAYGRRIPISSSSSRYSSSGSGSRYSRYSRAAAPVAAAPIVTVPETDTFLKTLQEMVPGAGLHLDRKAGRLMAFATQEEHAMIKSVIEKLGGTATADEVPLVEVYPIIHSDPDSLKEMFESLFPGVQINIDKTTNSMVIFAYPNEHTSIKTTLDQMLPPPVAGAVAMPTATELRFYPLKNRYPTTLQTVLADLVPNAKVTYDVYNSRLIVVGSATDHELIARGVDELETAKAEDRNRLVVYPVTPVQKSRFSSVLKSLVRDLPGVVVLPDARPTELAIWATALHHEAIAGILEQFDGEGVAVEGECQMVAYPVKATDPTSVESMLADLFPNVRMLVDRKGSKLLIWATESEHEHIKKSIATIISEPSPEEQPRFETYTIRSLSKRSSTTVRVFESHLEDLVPNATLTLDSTSGELIVWGTPEEQSLVRTAIERLSQGGSPENTPVLKIYLLDDVDTTTLQTLLGQLARDAELSFDSNSAKMIALAVPADHEVIQKTLDELAASELPEHKAELRFHTLKEASATEVARVLGELVPKADVTVDARSGRLTVMATAEDQEKVTETIAKLEEATATKAELQFHPIQDELPSDIMRLLAQVAPDAEITLDADNDRLMVMGTAEDHQKISETIAKVEEGGTTKPELRFHDLAEELPATVLRLLGEMAPKAEITEDPDNDRLMVLATEEDHQKISDTIAMVEEAGSTKPELRFYPTEEELPDAVLSILETLAPKARITPDASGKYLTVVASAADHEVIKATVEQVATTLPAEEKAKLAIYSVSSRQQARFETVLKNVTAELPSVELIPDTTPGQLSIWAIPSEHEVLAGILDELSQDVPPEEKFQLVAYTLKSADPESVTEILDELFPDTKVTLDAKSNRLMIWTRLEEHEAIRAAFAQIDVEGPAEEQRRFEVYPIQGITGMSRTGREAKATAFLENLQTLVPNAKLSIDPETGNLVAFATPTEHEIIGTAVAKLGSYSSIDHTPQLEIHELTTADPTTTLPLLEGLVPRAEITLDAVNDRLIVLAPPDSQEAIRNTLAQLQSTDPGATDPQVRVINLQQKPSKALTDVLAQLAPDASVTVEEESKRLVVVATEAEHEIIKRTVEQIDGALTEDEENSLMVYPVTATQRKRFEAIITSLKKDLPDVEVIDDDSTTQLSVWAKPSEHRVIGEVLMQVKSGLAPEAQKRFESYSIQGVIGYEVSRTGRLTAAATLMTGLAELVPDVKLMIDSNTYKLVAWATPEEHELLTTALDKLAPSGGEGGPQLQIYSLSNKAPENLVSGLRKLVPEADVSLDVDGKSLTVVASADDHAMIQEAVDRLETASSGKGQPYFDIYEVRGLGGTSTSLRYANARTFMTTLKPMVPEATLSIDYESGSVIAFATAEEHALLKTAVEKLTLSGPDNKPELVIYELKKRPPRSLLDGLEQLVPRAEITLDDDDRHLTVVANAAEQAAIKAALDKIDAATSDEGEPYFKVYTVTAISPSARNYSNRYSAARNMMEQLEDFAPKANISIDFASGNLLVFGTTDEHEVIGQAITSLTGGGSEDDPATLVVYRMNKADERAAFYLLQNLVPRAKLSLDYRTDAIMAFAVADDHVVIKNTIQQLDLGADNPNTPEMRFHTMLQAPPKNLLDGLEELAPKAEITYDNDSRQLMVIATADEHAIIEKNLKIIQETTAAETKTDLAVYPIDSADMQTVQEVLEELVPGIRIQLDEKNDKMIVTAMADQQVEIAAAIEKMDADADGGSAEKTVAYTINEVDSRTAISILTSLVPDMQIHADASGGKIVAFGRERDHKIAAEAIEQMETGPDEAHKPHLVVYPAGDADPTTMAELLAVLVPKANVVVDSNSDSIAVFAIAKDQEDVLSAIKSMSATAMGAGKPMAMTYTLTEMTAAGAMQVLQLAVPDAQLATGADPKQLVAWADARDQATIKTTIEAIDVEMPEGSKQTAAVYVLEGVNPRSAYYSLRVIRDAVPNAGMTLGADPTQVVVWATPEDHETVKQLVKSIVERDPALEPVMELYALDLVDALDAIKILEDMVPDAELSVGNDAGQLVAWARPKDQETIKGALEKLTAADASPTAPTMEVYTLESGDALSAMNVLEDVVPEAQLSVGKSASQLVAWARPADHEKIKEAVAKLDDSGLRPTMKIYELEKIEALSVLRMLRFVVPEANGGVGADSRQLIVWATEDNHVQVQKTIDQMTQDVPEGKAPLAVTYQLNSLTAETAEEVLLELAPDAKFTEGEDEYQLIIWARPEEHVEIEKTLQRIDVEGAGGGSEKAAVYEIEANPRLLIYITRFLKGVVPKAEFTPGVTPGQVVAWARPKDHELIAELVEQLSEDGRSVVLYDVGTVPVQTATLSLRRIVPEAILTQGATPSQLVIWASSQDHEKIKEVVDQLTSADSPELMPRAVTYALEHITMQTASPVLQFAVPQAQLSPGNDEYQLIAWATPKDQEVIAKTLETIDVEGPEDKSMLLGVYQLETIDLRQLFYLSRLIGEMVPGATFSPGVVPGQLIAWARPKDHERIAELIQEVEGSDYAPEARTYDLGDRTTTETIPILTRIVTSARYMTGKSPYELIAWARPDEHERIKEIIESITAEEPPETAPKMVIYSLDGPSPNAVLLLIRQVVPQARPMAGAEPHQLIVWARPEDHEKIRELIDELSADGPPGTMPSMEVYALENIDALTASALLRSIVPEASLSVGKDAQQLIAWARPHDHRLITAALERLMQDESAETAPQMQVYTLESGDVLSAMRVLAPIVPDAQISAGSTADQLVAWARPKDHEKIKQALVTLDAPGTKPEMKLYGLQGTDALTATQLLRSVAPEAVCSVGKDSYELVVWARPADHEEIQKALDEMSSQESPETLPTAVVYSLEEISSTSAIALLQLAVPQARVSVGSEAYQLLVWARPADHTKVEETLQQIDVPGPEDKQSTAIAYKLDGSTVQRNVYVLRFLISAVPTARFTLGVETDQIIAWAQPKDHEEIAKLVEELQGGAENAPKTVVYELKNIPAASVLTMLARVAPEAVSSVGADPYQLLVFARPDDHENVQQLVDELSTVESPETAPRAVTYALAEVSATSAMEILQLGVPQARVSQGEESYQLLVWARPDDHLKVKEILDQIDVEEPEDKKSTAIAYKLNGSTMQRNMYVLRFLIAAVPTARFTLGVETDQIIAWAQPKDHEEIAKLVEELQGGADNVPTAITYTLKNVTGTVVTSTVRQVVPEAVITPGSDPYQLTIYARPDDHEKIKQIVDELSMAESPETAPRAVTYTLEEITAENAMALLQLAVPQAQLNVGTEEYQLIVWARPDDHLLVEETLQQIDVKGPDEKMAKVVVYDLGLRDMRRIVYVLRFIQSAVPDSRLTLGSSLHELIAWGRPKDHEEIQKLVDEFAGTEETAPKMQIHLLESVDAAQAIALLRTIVPEAQFGVGANSRQLIAWARPADQVIIENAVAEMGREESPETAPLVQVYTVETVDAVKAIAVLATAVPEATVSAGNDARQLVIFARPAEHEKIKVTLEQLARKGPEDQQPSIVVYSLETSGATYAMQVLQPILPEAQFTLGSDPSKLIVWGYPEDHATIEAAVEQIEADSWLDGNRIMSVYSMKPEDVTTLLKLLDPVIRENAQFLPDVERECLIVWADKRYDEAIKRTIEEFQAVVPEIVEPIAVVYRFEKTDVLTAYNILQTLVPEARFAYDYRSGSLVATAMPEDHEKIAQTIDEMNRDAIESAPRLKVHHIVSADPDRVLTIITNLFRAEPSVQLSLDEANDSLIAYASPVQHTKIEELVAEIEKGTQLDSALSLKLHSLKNVDSYAATSILEDMFTKQGVKVDLTIDRYSNQLMAMARPEQHEKIVEILDQIRTEERVMEVYQLDYVDLNTASLAIRRLFADESYLTQPDVDPDMASGQLLVRATIEQQKEVLKLLIRMGETNLAPSQRSSSGNLRVVPLKGDVKGVVEQVQRVWSSLRENEIRVVAPEQIPDEETEEEEEKTTEPSGPQEAAKVEVKATTLADKQVVPPEGSEETVADEVAEPEALPVVMLVAGEDSITIASEDQEALDELESLLRTISSRGNYSNREYSLYQIKNTTATQVALTLQTLFRSRDPRMQGNQSRSRYGSSYGSRYGLSTMPAPLIIPDDRLNTLLVKGSRSDRQTIEGLLEILDTPEISESAALGYEPRMIPIKHTDAARVAQMVQTVYRSYFTTATPGSKFAPQLTIDTTTNSLIVKAPPEILEDITKFAQSLDTAADEETADRLRLIPLKNANALRVQEALNAMMRGSSGYRAPSVYRPR